MFDVISGVCVDVIQTRPMSYWCSYNTSWSNSRPRFVLCNCCLLISREAAILGWTILHENSSVPKFYQGHQELSTKQQASTSDVFCKRYRASLVAQLVKNLPAVQETLFDSWVRKLCWRRDRLPTPVFWPGESHGLYSRKVLDTPERLSLS